MTTAKRSHDLETGREVLRLEAAALNDLAENLPEAFSGAVSLILAAKGRVICVGVGKSGHVARKIASTFSSTGTPAYFVHATEASHGDLGMIREDDVILAISRSGDTAELNDLIQYSRRFRVSLIAMTVNADSVLGDKADIVLSLPDAPEACSDTRAPTTSTTLMMALGDALAVALLRRRGFNADGFRVFHPGGKLGAMLKTAGELMRTGSATPEVSLDAPFEAALQEMSDKNLGCVGVVDANGALAGIITDGDLRRLLSSGSAPKTAGDAMTPDPIVATRGALAAETLQTMNERKITQLFIVENGRPVGVLHMHDVLKAGVV